MITILFVLFIVIPIIAFVVYVIGNLLFWGIVLTVVKLFRYFARRP